MIKRYKHIAAVLGMVALFGLGGAGTAHANPSYFAMGTSTSAASSSPAYMTAGVSTSTTPVFDAYAQTLSGGAVYKSDYAGLLLRFIASSTATVLSQSVEYSQDGIDWYRNLVADPNQIGTTTTPTSLARPFSNTWTFASSSVGGAAPLANNNQATAALIIPTPFRYTRIVFSLTGGNGAIWAQLLPVKERP